MAEQLICNQQVVGSIPIASSNETPLQDWVLELFYFLGKTEKWLKWVQMGAIHQQVVGKDGQVIQRYKLVAKETSDNAGTYEVAEATYYDFIKIKGTLSAN